LFSQRIDCVVYSYNLLSRLSICSSVISGCCCKKRCIRESDNVFRFIASCLCLNVSFCSIHLFNDDWFDFIPIIHLSAYFSFESNCSYISFISSFAFLSCYVYSIFYFYFILLCSFI